MNKYWAIIDGQSKGPLSIEELEELNIKKTTRVSIDGSDVWDRAENIQELDSLWLPKSESQNPPKQSSILNIIESPKDKQEYVVIGNAVEFDDNQVPDKPISYLVKKWLFVIGIISIAAVACFIYITKKTEEPTIILPPCTNKIDSLLVSGNNIVFAQNPTERLTALTAIQNLKTQSSCPNITANTIAKIKLLRDACVTKKTEYEALAASLKTDARINETLECFKKACKELDNFLETQQSAK